MKNPWIDFLRQSSVDRFHDADRDNARAFNFAMKRRKNYILAEHLEPFPYLGNPYAQVLVLLANPGKNKQEEKLGFKIQEDKLDLSNQNLLHKGDEFKKRLNSPDKPHLESSWFKLRTRKLVETVGVEAVVKGLFLVNFHAYHSKSWYPIPFTFETQRYSFNLVNNAIKRGALILMSRNTVGWLTAVPKLVEYKNRFEFQSSRSVHISQNNLPNGIFKRIENAII